MQTVWYFELPTIGYCPECDRIAEWDSVRGLHCPECKTQEVSLFTWNGEDPYPE